MDREDDERRYWNGAVLLALLNLACVSVLVASESLWTLLAASSNRLVLVMLVLGSSCVAYVSLSLAQLSKRKCAILAVGGIACALTWFVLVIRICAGSPWLSMIEDLATVLCFASACIQFHIGLKAWDNLGGWKTKR